MNESIINGLLHDNFTVNQILVKLLIRFDRRPEQVEQHKDLLTKWVNRMARQHKLIISVWSEAQVESDVVMAVIANGTRPRATRTVLLYLKAFVIKGRTVSDVQRQVLVVLVDEMESGYTVSIPRGEVIPEVTFNANGAGSAGGCQDAD